MNMMSRFVAGGLLAAAALATAPAQATQIPDGTASIVGTFSPTVNLASNPSTFSAAFGNTFQITGDGGFTGVAGGSGTLNGVINFSSVVNTTLAQSLADFFVFNDGVGGQFQFSVASVKTLSYAVADGSSAIGLYLLGSTLDLNPGHAYDPTLTSLTLTFNSTNGSAYAASATLSVPPADVPGVPEPATWGLTLLGFGAMGAAMRRRPRTSVSFA
jgi:hypothetical protein